MTEAVKYVGLDVHKETIAVAVADGQRGGEVRFIGTVANEDDAVRKLVKRLTGPGVTLNVCYEAGPCGYGLHRLLTKLGQDCIVIAPSMMPRRPGDHVKTDRRDAMTLARLLRAGELTAIWVPDEAHEAVRDLIRARRNAQDDAIGAKQDRHGRLNRLGDLPPFYSRSTIDSKSRGTCHGGRASAIPHYMEPHQSGIRGIATTFGWTWYRMRRLIDAYLACQGASMAQLKLLAYLAEQPRRSTDIASFFDQAPRTVTQAIDALEQNGLVSRSPAPDDRRSKLVQITDAGRATLGLAMPLYDDIVGQTFGSLTADELEGLDAAIKHLNRLVDHLETKASVPETQVPAPKSRAHD